MNDKRILLVDVDPATIDSIHNRLQANGYEVHAVYDSVDALVKIEEVQPALVCVDMHMPANNGRRLYEKLRADMRNDLIPLIVLTGAKDQAPRQHADLRNVRFVEKTADVERRVEDVVNELIGDRLGESIDNQPQSQVGNVELYTPGELLNPEITQRDPILDAVFGALGMSTSYLDEAIPMAKAVSSPNKQGASRRSTSTQPAIFAQSAISDLSDDAPWVLHVDDDDTFRDIVRLRLGMYGIRVVNANNGIAGIQEAFTRRVGAIVLDFEMPNGRGDYVLNRLKGNPVTMDIPVVVLSGVNDAMLTQRLLSMGAAAYFCKPPQFDKLSEKILELTCAAI